MNEKNKQLEFDFIQGSTIIVNIDPKHTEHKPAMINVTIII